MFKQLLKKPILLPAHLLTSLVILALSVIVMAQTSQIAKAADLSSHYTWKPLVITGGGWVVGLTIDPNVPDVMYARTDVGSAYKWDVTNQRWNQLMTVSHIGTTFVNTDSAPLGGGVFRDRAMQVEAIAVDPSNPNKVFMAAGADAAGTNGVIFRSTDGAATFQPATTTPPISMCGNCEGRMYGDRLAIDPHNSNILYPLFSPIGWAGTMPR